MRGRRGSVYDSAATYLAQGRYPSEKDTASYQAISVRTLRKWARQIPHFRVGKKSTVQEIRAERVDGTSLGDADKT
jgi:hypothetical protein